MTVSEPGQPQTADPLASQRTELLGQLVAAQFDLESVVAELMRNGDGASQAHSQLQALMQLQRQVGAADGAAIMLLRSSVGDAVALSQSVVQQSRATINNVKLEQASNHEVARDAVTSLADNYYEQRVLDPYLRFSSAEEEAAYRKRERENKEAIDREWAKNTPEGTASALRIIEQQLLDAGAHGADASPDYASMLDKAQRNRALLEADLERGAQSATGKDAATASAPTSDLDDAFAALRAAGVVTDDTARLASGHGLRDDARISAQPLSGRTSPG